jgi:hypothetical protein
LNRVPIFLEAAVLKRSTRSQVVARAQKLHPQTKTEPIFDPLRRKLSFALPAIVFFSLSLLEALELVARG